MGRCASKEGLVIDSDVLPRNTGCIGAGGRAWEGAGQLCGQGYGARDVACTPVACARADTALECAARELHPTADENPAKGVRLARPLMRHQPTSRRVPAVYVECRVQTGATEDLAVYRVRNSTHRSAQRTTTRTVSFQSHTRGALVPFDHRQSVRKNTHDRFGRFDARF
jgi:hypothetical protein